MDEEIKILRRHVKEVLKVMREGSTILDNNYLSCLGRKRGLKPFKAYKKKQNEYIVTVGEFELKPVKLTNPQYPLALKLKRKKIKF